MQKEEDYSFMKSGFDNLNKKDDTVENVASIVLVFMENAIKSASIYVKHANRNTITAEDVKRCLMLETFFIKKRTNMLEQCEEMKNIIIKSLEEDEEFIDDLEDDDDEEEDFSQSSCKCALCNCVNSIYTRWENYTPETTIEKAMWTHINHIS